MRHDGRRPDQLRELDIQPDYLEQPHGSVLYAQGKTIVLCTATVEAVREYAAPLEAAGVDTVILGCTHYPLIRPILQRVFGRGVTLVFSAEETAREAAETLARKGIENDDDREGAYRFLTTGDPKLFRELGRRFLQLPIESAERVEVAALEAVA